MQGYKEGIARGVCAATIAILAACSNRSSRGCLAMLRGSPRARFVDSVDDH